MPRTAKKDAGEAKVKKAAASSGGTKRKSSAYNLYIKSALAELKASNPDMPHKERFKLAAQKWKTHPDNPKKE
ncbi:hypothetical protein BT69DRAFT_1288089 [Atractiella rhizophila]|nr:hypothetical protein BT69DRAFT_1288089 [Atractiella rhizophila]